MNKRKDYDEIHSLYADRLSTPGTTSKGQKNRQNGQSVDNLGGS